MSFRNKIKLIVFVLNKNKTKQHKTFKTRDEKEGLDNILW